MNTLRLSATTRRRRGLSALVVVIGTAPLIVSFGQGASASGQSYVSLGDSYTSGPDIPTQETDPAGCLRSTNNYPSETAAALGLSLTDVSCSGATTANILTTAESVSPGPANPPQLDAVTSTTQVVSIQVGGDDLGFTSIIENCVALTPFGPTKVGLNCKNYYDAHGVNSLLNDINALEPKIVSIIQDVHTDAPGAKVFVLGYPDILPQTGACWPSMPFETSDALYLNQTEVELNTMLASAAGANSATYVDTYTPSMSHNACTSEANRWIEPIVPASPAYPVHPNANGEAGMAQALETAMKSAGI
jgi:hypothetical protein